MFQNYLEVVYFFAVQRNIIAINYLTVAVFKPHPYNMGKQKYDDKMKTVEHKQTLTKFMLFCRKLYQEYDN